MQTPGDPLDELLNEWQVRGDAPPSFQREVWARIAAEDAEVSWMERWAATLFKPMGWVTAAAVAIALGAGAAWMESQPSRLSPHDAYVRSISPFASLHLASH